MLLSIELKELEGKFHIFFNIFSSKVVRNNTFRNFFTAHLQIKMFKCNKYNLGHVQIKVVSEMLTNFYHLFNSQ